MTLVAVAHGSRKPAAQASVRALLDAVRADRPGLEVREAYLELASPSLPEVLREVSDPVIVPLLLGNGYHVAHDVACMAAVHRPDARCAPALGPHPLLAEALADRLAQAQGLPAWRGPVVLAGAGSSDPRSHADADSMAAMLAARLQRPVLAAYHSSSRPSVVETVAALRAAGHPLVSVATYLLSPGRFATEVAACGADVVSAPLGAHPALVRLILSRYDAVVAGTGVAAGVLASR